MGAVGFPEKKTFRFTSQTAATIYLHNKGSAAHLTSPHLSSPSERTSERTNERPTDRPTDRPTKYPEVETSRVIPLENAAVISPFPHRAVPPRRVAVFLNLSDVFIRLQNEHAATTASHHVSPVHSTHVIEGRERRKLTHCQFHTSSMHASVRSLVRWNFQSVTKLLPKPWAAPDDATTPTFPSCGSLVGLTSFRRAAPRRGACRNLGQMFASGNPNHNIRNDRERTSQRGRNNGRTA